MNQVLTTFNLIKSDRELMANGKPVELRGYKENTFLTGEFASRIAEKSLKPLSVSDVADDYCPTRRDLYFKKGANRPTKKDRQKKYWGQKAGHLIEAYLLRVLDHAIGNGPIYDELIKESDVFHQKFLEERQKTLDELRQLESKASGDSGQTDWILNNLKGNCANELGIGFLHTVLRENDCCDRPHVFLRQELKPNPVTIGISSPSEPDFIVPDFRAVGDIKTGDRFKVNYQSTCAGYALAYENALKRDIDWGVIYFFPTRVPSVGGRPMAYGQVYLFHLNDALRDLFIAKRDRAYEIVSRDAAPNLPKDKEGSCIYCRFRNKCWGEE